MYYRRKIALALIQSFGGRIGKTQFQKLLFLWTQFQKKPAYHFVPYKYGCYSFHSNADMKTLTKYKLVEENISGPENNFKEWVKIDDVDYVGLIDAQDRATLKVIKAQFHNMGTRDLTAYVYRQFPYFAINSTIADQLLTETELLKVKRSKPQNSKQALYSIGYEGISLETYLNRLIKFDVQLLCDVRKNPLSRKFGFSKNQLKFACNSVGIDYLHLPELGIVSDKRIALNTQSDYDKLFEDYCSSTLIEQNAMVSKLLDLVETRNRVAITCFEANIHQCHRKHLAEKVAELPAWRFELEHI